MLCVTWGGADKQDNTEHDKEGGERAEHPTWEPGTGVVSKSHASKDYK